MGASPPQDGKLFCLACLHARTHARTHTLNSRVAHPKKLPGLSVRLSVRPSPPPLSRVFAVFLDLLVDAHRFFDECLEDFA